MWYVDVVRDSGGERGFLASSNVISRRWRMYSLSIPLSPFQPSYSQVLRISVLLPSLLK